jgi:hypothetical protein
VVDIYVYPCDAAGRWPSQLCAAGSSKSCSLSSNRSDGWKAKSTFPTSLQDLYAFSSQGTNPSSFCWGLHNTACLYTDPSLSYASSEGKSDDGTIAWNLTFAGVDAESWWMLNKASTAIGKGHLVSLSWRHAIPRAIVSGTLTIKGQSVDFDGIGQKRSRFWGFYS